jgi:hypothetical protein
MARAPKTSKEIKAYRNIDEFLLNEDFPANPKFDLFGIFKETERYMRDVQMCQDPDIILWNDIKKTFLDIFDSYGHSESAFLLRLKDVTGYESPRKIKASITTPDEQRKSIDSQKNDLKPIPSADLDRILNMNALSEEEEVTKRTREKAYKDDFNLNNSSDVPILAEVLSCEMALARFTLYEQRNPRTFIGEERDLIFTRLQKAQNTLGVSRIKRTEGSDDLTDTIASAVETYEYMAQFVDLDRLEFLEELDILIQRYNRGEIEAWLFVSYIGEIPTACIQNLGMTVHDACKDFVDKQIIPFFLSHEPEIAVLTEKCKSVKI